MKRNAANVVNAYLKSRGAATIVVRTRGSVRMRAWGLWDRMVMGWDYLIGIRLLNPSQRPEPILERWWASPEQEAALVKWLEGPKRGGEIIRPYFDEDLSRWRVMIYRLGFSEPSHSVRIIHVAAWPPDGRRH